MAMAMDGFKQLDERQAALCRAIGIAEPDRFCVIRETDQYLLVRHHRAYTEVMIHKNETTKRNEKELGLWS